MKTLKLLLAGLIIGFVASEAMNKYDKIKKEKEIEDKEIADIKFEKKIPKSLNFLEIFDY